MGTNFGGYEPVIGLEVHAQLLTRTKAFCGCATSFGDPPNTHTCPVCLGLPGALPVLNGEAVKMAVSAALALGCLIRPTSIFARKNYFYPDLPKGYQISQYDLPLAMHGGLEIDTETGGRRRIGILRVHMEEDAGKNMHGIGTDSVVDLNRAGTPLIEIVGDPDLRSAAEAAEYLRRLRDILMFIRVNDGNLEQGSFRCDANVSVRKVGETKLGTRTEIKNINSFRFVAEAIDVEVHRQIAALGRGERIRQQTRGYNSDKRETYLLRDKENESGYRYFPEPDLPPLVVDEAFVDAARAALPALPAERRRRLVEELGLTPYAAGVLTSHPAIAAFVDEAARLYPDTVKIGNFIQGEVMRDVHLSGLTATFPVAPRQIAELLRLVDRGTISGKQAKEVYAAMAGTGQSPDDIVRERCMAVLSNEAEIEEIARKVLEENPKQVTGFRDGKTTLMGFFVGQIMKRTGGSASPAIVNAVLTRLLGERSTTKESLPFRPDPTTLRKARPAPPDENPPESLTPPEPSSRGKERSPLAQSVAPKGDTLTSLGVPVVVPAPPLVPVRVTEVSSKVPVLPMAGTASLDVLAQLDLRVGVILEAARVPRKDKLLDLQVDTGDEGGPRRIVAGLALSFTPEELVGKRVIVACNLEPRAFSKELVSFGMILAAGPSDALALSTVSRDLPPGTRVK